MVTQGLLQWSRRCDSNAEGAGSISGQKLRSFMPQPGKKRGGNLEQRIISPLRVGQSNVQFLLLETQVESGDFVDFFCVRVCSSAFEASFEHKRFISKGPVFL